VLSLLRLHIKKKHLPVAREAEARGAISISISISNSVESDEIDRRRN
jgi:hypothetical protein